MAEQYRDTSGRTYSPDQVERVAGSYYVKGTSINVSPVRSSSSSGSSSTTGAASGSSGSGSSSYLKSLMDAEAKKYGVTPVSDTPSSPYYKEISSGTSQYSPSSGSSSGGGLNPLAIEGYKWGQGYYSSKTMSDVIKDKLNQLQAQTQSALDIIKNWQPPQMPTLPPLQTPSTLTQTPPPKVETAPQVENVPAEATAQQQAAPLPAGVSQGAGGFTYQASAPPVLPTVDKLLETYRQVFGKADQDVQQYLQSPEFQSVLKGNVPMWMEADPLWRRYLQMLGISRRLQEQQRS